jgi:hypothetical protein
MIVLRSEELLVRLDPAHGGEILDLVHLESGRQLLGRPPFATEPPRPGDLDEPVWTASYRGGWQLVTPNAGTMCEVDGVRHGFHGRASNDPWAVVEAAAGAAVLAWEGHGLGIERRLVLEGGAVVVETRMRALAGRVPVVAVEHCSLGLELLEPEVEIELPGGTAYELSEAEGPATAPAGAPSWPEVLLLDGSVERADHWQLAKERSRFIVVADLPEGRAAVRNARTGMTLELSWDAGWLRHAWIWHEVRTYGGPWREQAEVLVIEPASVPHGLGLAEAIAHGQARWLEPGEPVTYRMAARPAVT